MRSKSRSIICKAETAHAADLLDETSIVLFRGGFKLCLVRPLAGIATLSRGEMDDPVTQALAVGVPRLTSEWRSGIGPPCTCCGGRLLQQPAVFTVALAAAAESFMIGAVCAACALKSDEEILSPLGGLIRLACGGRA
jgi:hypothetical protein